MRDLLLESWLSSNKDIDAAVTRLKILCKKNRLKVPQQARRDILKWGEAYESRRSLADKPRSGRPCKTTPQQDLECAKRLATGRPTSNTATDSTGRIRKGPTGYASTWEASRQDPVIAAVLADTGISLKRFLVKMQAAATADGHPLRLKTWHMKLELTPEHKANRMACATELFRQWMMDERMLEHGIFADGFSVYFKDPKGITCKTWIMEGLEDKTDVIPHPGMGGKGVKVKCMALVCYQHGALLCEPTSGTTDIQRCPKMLAKMNGATHYEVSQQLASVQP
jgi:hypothetical protein